MYPATQSFKFFMWKIYSIKKQASYKTPIGKKKCTAICTGILFALHKPQVPNLGIHKDGNKKQTGISALQHMTDSVKYYHLTLPILDQASKASPTPLKERTIWSMK